MSLDRVKQEAETFWRTAGGRTKKRTIVGIVFVAIIVVALLHSCVAG